MACKKSMTENRRKGRLLNSSSRSKEPPIILLLAIVVELDSLLGLLDRKDLLESRSPSFN